MGFATSQILEGNIDVKTIFDHFIKVNKCTKEDFENHLTKMFKLAEKRNRKVYTVDFIEFLPKKEKTERKPIYINGRRV